MKRIIAVWALLAFANAKAQTIENFNTKPGVSTNQVRSYLQTNCWVIADFDVNRNGWTPTMEGNGAMVSSALGNGHPNSGIFTPVLNINGSLTVTFLYQFSEALAANASRKLSLLLVNAEHQTEQVLDEISFTKVTPNSTYTYEHSFSNLKNGAYKLCVKYSGVGGATKVAIDQLQFSAPYFYNNGCNEAPVASNETITGMPDRTATGSLMATDKNTQDQKLSYYIVGNSPDGEVKITADNQFSFVPKPDFKGNSTKFTYQACDNGAGALCSNQATVTLQFPAGTSNGFALANLKGNYESAGDVVLDWNSIAEVSGDRYEIERSTDGKKWSTVGSLKAAGRSSQLKSYRFSDHVGSYTAKRKDLFYRLKAVNTGGEAWTSKILVVRVYNSTFTQMISVAPDVAKNDITATVQLNEPAIIVMKVVDNAGSEIMRKSIKANGGSNTLAMEGTNNLGKGNYTFEVIVNSTERMSVALIKE
jgi:hypothetical protein